MAIVIKKPKKAQVKCIVCLGRLFDTYNPENYINVTDSQCDTLNIQFHKCHKCGKENKIKVKVA